MHYGLIPSDSAENFCKATEITDQCNDDLTDEKTILKALEPCRDKKDCVLRFEKGKPLWLRKSIGK